MKVLVLGAGAVGQVYGRHLALGGAHVSFFVKPKHEAEARRGYTMYPLNRSRSPDPIDFSDYGVLTGYESISDERWDQVWICTSSTALRGGWLPEVTTRLGDATLVCMTPGPEDREYVLQYVDEASLVVGLITMISYQTPLEGEQREHPGTAYWFPPMAANAFSGSRASEAASALRACRLRPLPAWW